MKTTITEDGFLTIKPETELEAYALGQWCKTSFTEPTNEACSQFIGKLHVSGELDKTSAVTPYSGQRHLVLAAIHRLTMEFENVVMHNVSGSYEQAQSLIGLSKGMREVIAEYAAA